MNSAKLDRDQRGYLWTVREIGRRARMTRSDVETELNYLADVGLVEVEETFTGRITEAAITQEGALLARKRRWTVLLGGLEIELRASIFALRLRRARAEIETR